jgi:hypothetical protein
MSLGIKHPKSKSIWGTANASRKQCGSMVQEHKGAYLFVRYLCETAWKGESDKVGCMLRIRLQRNAKSSPTIPFYSHSHSQSWSVSAPAPAQPLPRCHISGCIIRACSIAIARASDPVTHPLRANKVCISVSSTAL